MGLINFKLKIKIRTKIEKQNHAAENIFDIHF